MEKYIVMFILIVFCQSSFSQQLVSYKIIDKSSTSVFSIVPKRKMTIMTDKGYSSNNIIIKRPNDDVLENSSFVEYSISTNPKIKYNTHFEGQVKDCKTNQAIPRVFVTLNSGLVADQYVVIATNMEGRFNIDINDDFISGITLLKNGYENKEIHFLAAPLINEKNLYPINNLCLTATE